MKGGISEKTLANLEKLKEDNVVETIANSPLMMLFLCSVVRDNEGIVPSSKTALYNRLVENVFLRCEEKLDCSVDQSKIKDALAELAYYGIVNNMPVYSKSDSNVSTLIESTDHLLDIGFLTKRQSTHTLARSELYSFVHKTVQEYFCSLYICSQLGRWLKVHKLKRMLNKIKNASTYSLSVVLLFLCGVMRERNRIQYILANYVPEEFPLQTWHRIDGHLYLRCLHEIQSTGTFDVTLLKLKHMPDLINRQCPLFILPECKACMSSVLVSAGIVCHTDPVSGFPARTGLGIDLSESDSDQSDSDQSDSDQSDSEVWHPGGSTVSLHPFLRDRLTKVWLLGPELHTVPEIIFCLSLCPRLVTMQMVHMQCTGVPAADWKPLPHIDQYRLYDTTLSVEELVMVMRWCNSCPKLTEVALDDVHLSPSEGGSGLEVSPSPSPVNPQIHWVVWDRGNRVQSVIRQLFGDSVCVEKEEYSEESEQSEESE